MLYGPVLAGASVTEVRFWRAPRAVARRERTTNNVS
jgi:hypothetical protein